MEIRTPHWW